MEELTIRLCKDNPQGFFAGVPETMTDQ